MPGIHVTTRKHCECQRPGFGPQWSEQCGNTRDERGSTVDVRCISAIDRVLAAAAAAAAASSSERQQRATIASNSSEQQQQQRATATAASSSNYEQHQVQRAAAAATSSEQRAAAAASSSEQQQQGLQQQRLSLIHTHPYISTCISRMYLPYLDCISVNISYQSRIISQYRARHSYKKSLPNCIQLPPSLPLQLTHHPHTRHYHLRYHPSPQGESGTTPP